MKFRTGDILVWRSTKSYDLLGESTISLPGLHSGIIFVGSIFSKLSTCGPSPSNTYVTFLVDRIFPIEEVIGHIWHRPNGCSLHIISRRSGREVPEEEAYQVYTKFLELKKRPVSHTVYYACVAYLKMGSLIPETGHKGQRFHLCPSSIAYILSQLGFVSCQGMLNNILPMDFYHCRFFQTERYRRIDIFDKGTGDWEWLLTIPLIQWNLIDVYPICCPLIDEILKDYDYPRTISKDKDAKKQIRTYLLGTE